MNGDRLAEFEKRFTTLKETMDKEIVPLTPEEVNLTVLCNELISEVKRLTARDELYAELNAKIDEYYGKGGGYAALQDGHYALMETVTLQREAISKRGTDYGLLSLYSSRKSEWVDDLQNMNLQLQFEIGNQKKRIGELEGYIRSIEENKEGTPLDWCGKCYRGQECDIHD